MRPANKVIPIGSLLGAMSQDRNWRERLGLHAVFLFWDELVGGGIAERAQPRMIRGTVLWVAVSDPVWLQQLHLERGVLLGRINGRLTTEKKLTDIRFQVDSALEQEGIPVEQPPAPLPLPLSSAEAKELEVLLAELGDKEARTTLRRLWLKAHNRSG